MGARSWLGPHELGVWHEPQRYTRKEEEREETSLSLLCLKSLVYETALLSRPGNVGAICPPWQDYINARYIKATVPIESRDQVCQDYIWAKQCWEILRDQG